MITAHVVVRPVQAPDQLENVWPRVGVAVRCTVDPRRYCALHAVPQLIPGGALVTVPNVERVMVSGRFVVTNLALAVFEADIMTEQLGSNPVHAPDQPANI